MNSPFPRIKVRPQGEANLFALLDDGGQWLATVLANGSMSTEKQQELLTYMADCANQHEDLLVEVAELRSRLSTLLALTQPLLSRLNAPMGDSRSPTLYCVFSKQPTITRDDYDHDRVEWYDSNNGCYVDPRFVRRLELLLKHWRTTFAENRGWERVAIKDVETFETAALTKEGCDAYIKANAHKLRDPVIKPMPLSHNHELVNVLAILQALKELDGPRLMIEPLSGVVSITGV